MNTTATLTIHHTSHSLGGRHASRGPHLLRHGRAECAALPANEGAQGTPVTRNWEIKSNIFVSFHFPPLLSASSYFFLAASTTAYSATYLNLPCHFTSVRLILPERWYVSD